VFDKHAGCEKYRISEKGDENLNEIKKDFVTAPQTIFFKTNIRRVFIFFLPALLCEVVF
jgi:hypothetical protein